jgi:hypothetical protein
MTVPMENIVGGAKSDQMVGGHRGLGMLYNVMNDPFRNAGRGRAKNYKAEAKLEQYRSQLRREEAAHAANIDHGQHVEMFKDDGFLQQAIRHSTVGGEYDENGEQVGTFVGKDSTTGGNPWGEGPTSSSADPQVAEDHKPATAEETQQQQEDLGVVQTPVQPTPQAPTRRVASSVMSGQFKNLKWGGADQIVPPSRIPPVKKPEDQPQAQEDSPQEETPQDTDTIQIGGSGQTFIPVVHDLRGPSVRRNPVTGKMEAIPERARLKEENDKVAAGAKDRRARDLAAVNAKHRERTGVDMPQAEQDKFLSTPESTLTLPTPMSSEYDEHRAAGEEGFDQPSPIETIKDSSTTAKPSA